MSYPTESAIIAYFVLVAMGLLIHLVDRIAFNRRSMLRQVSMDSRISGLKALLSFGRKHLIAVLSIALGALAMAGLGQNAHRLWLVHLGFGVTYLILLTPLIWGIARLLGGIQRETDEERSPVVGVVLLCGLFILIVIPFHSDKVDSLKIENTPNSHYPASQPQSANAQFPPRPLTVEKPTSATNASGAKLHRWMVKSPIASSSQLSQPTTYWGTNQTRQEATELADRVQKIGDDLANRLEEIRNKGEADRRRVTAEEFKQHYQPFIDMNTQGAYSRALRAYKECCQANAEELRKTFGDATDVIMESDFQYPTNPGGYRRVADDLRQLAKQLPGNR